MDSFREAGERPRGAGEGGPPARPPYDPLFASWQETAEATESELQTDLDFLMGGLGRRSGQTHAEDILTWEHIVRQPWRPEPRAPTWQPVPTPYQPPVTPLQQQLQAGTIAIPRPERRWAVTVRELVETLLLAVLIFLAVRASFQNFRVEGASMQPSLQDGEYLIVNKLSYAEIDRSIFNWLPFYEADKNSVNHLWDSPSRGDVIVFRAPTSISRDFIKRIIGLPGDTVTIEEATGKVSVNGTELAEPYIQGVTSCNTSCSYTIPKANTPESQADCGSNACYFVLGDNRQNSSDSRQGWLVPEENIIGKALITYWHEGNLNVDLAPNHHVGGANEVAAAE